MSINVDHSIAEKKLIEAFRKKQKTVSTNADNIIKILKGTHKTYKYVLITGLLAKACNNEVNPLALQAGASLKGAFDARSLCHKVFVPFERNFLSNAFGGSNEPFLNKPARFTHLSLKNAVRDGNDREILATLIKVLSSISTSAEAFRYLSYSLNVAIEIAGEQAKLNKLEININPTLLDIYDFIVHFLDKSFEGETCVIIVGTLEKIYYQGVAGKFKVVCHKVNQSGSSSKEIGDIDIHENEGYCYSIEVKDKSFTIYDLEHAYNKVIENGGQKAAFIYGPRATYDEKAIKIRIADYEKNKFFTILLDIYNYSKIMLFKSNINNHDQFINILLETAIEINAKDETKKWIHETIHKLKW